MVNVSLPLVGKELFGLMFLVNYLRRDLYGRERSYSCGQRRQKVREKLEWRFTVYCIHTIGFEGNISPYVVPEITVVFSKVY